MKIAIVGGGVSGLVTARLLCADHEITLFEANNYPGGHTNTIDVEAGGRSWAVDTGFIVFNERTYPNFIRLLDHLGVPSQASVMSFSVSSQRSGLEYCATNLNTLFAQRRNIFNPSFWGMLQDIFRFNRSSRELYNTPDFSLTLGDYLGREGYSQGFIDEFLVPMGSAIWSADPHRFLEFPAAAFVRFFTNHGILNVVDQPRWRVICGGSREYVEPLIRPFRERVRLATPVVSVRRLPDRVEVTAAGCSPERFDQVVLACHSDQTLALLADPTTAERDILGTIPYQPNETVLHSDETLLPRNPRARASWNCHLLREARDGVALTYWMNRLQSLAAPVEFCVTLNNPDAVAPGKVIRRLLYHHPVYSAAAFSAQHRLAEISGVNRTWYCGAYWGWGFHEDGVKSALAIGRAFGREF